MKKTIGIVRRIDDLGRVVLPKELRKSLGIDIGTPLEISMNGSKIILEKYKYKKCNECGQLLDENANYCSNCGERVEESESNRK